jgi:hypothetical protein
MLDMGTSAENISYTSYAHKIRTQNGSGNSAQTSYVHNVDIRNTVDIVHVTF